MQTSVKKCPPPLVPVYNSALYCLYSLTTLLLHSNQLTSLPHGLVELRKLSTLVIAFNQLIEIPTLLKELVSLSILVISGNAISYVYSCHCTGII